MNPCVDSDAGVTFLTVLVISFGGFPQLPLTIEAKKCEALVL
jgi:hypothetical protein